MRTAFMVLLFSGCLAFSQQPTDVISWTARGEQAFKSAHYGEAAGAFQHAIDIDSSNVSAHLYLGATFFVQFIPGANRPIRETAVCCQSRSRSSDVEFYGHG